MKAKLVSSIVLLFTSVICAGQVYIDGVAIDTLNTPFCQLICSNGGELNRTSITVDYGQRYKISAFSRQRIAGPDKQPIHFSSSVEALNFMVKQGWELAFFDSPAGNVYLYVLQRKRKTTTTE